ncbi:MAG: phosphoribosylanthranilate isomerase [Planctomycetes bacterium]|nr:phosphoribosylanthranilate isomerase [Planctomycetota bacterium]
MTDTGYQRTRIKICGVRDLETAEAAISAGADALGFVFANGSPRQVSCDRAEEIALEMSVPVPIVGVFRDNPRDQVLEVCQTVGLTMVQLHGREDPAYVAEIALDVPVIRALPTDPEQVACWSSNPDVEYLLLDGPNPGSGEPCDWPGLATILGDVKPTKPIILAGGLTPDTVGTAIKTVQPFAVDVSSGVESSRGKKEAGLIGAFCRAVAQADLSQHDH